MKVAILGIKTHPAYFGADRVVENLLNNFNKDIQFYIYLTTVDNIDKKVDHSNLHFIYIPTLKSKYLKAPIFFFLSALHAIIKGEYDFVHIHNADFGVFNLLVKLKYKIIGTSHGSPYLRDKWNTFGKIFLRLSEKIFICTSDILITVSLNQFKIWGEKLNKKKIYYIPNGVSLNEQIEELYLNKFNLQRNEYFLFCAGRIDKTKGLHTLINSYNLLTTNKKLFVIGDFNHDKNYSDEIFNISKQNKNIIIYNGLLPKAKLNYVMKNCYALVFPSEVEAMSMVLLEAISQKTPVICSDIPENINVLGKDYEFYFKNKDVDDLVKTIDKYFRLNSSEVIYKNYEDVLNKYSWSNIANKYEELYYYIGRYQ